MSDDTPPSTVVSIEEAGAFLTDRFGMDVTAVEPLRPGGWSSAYGFVRDNVSYVIRFSAHVDDFQRDRLAYRYVSADLPIPVVTEIGDAFGIHYAISERVSGVPIDDVDGRQLRELLPSLFAALDAMRHADVRGTSGYGGWGDDRNAPFPSWEAALLAVSEDAPGSRGSGWRRNLEHSTVGSASFDEAYDALVELVRHAPEDRHLIHSDPLNYNVLVSGRNLTGVIDWGCSMYGDFLYDLAWLVFWWPWRPAWKEIDILAEAKRHYAKIGLDIPDFDQRLRLCLIHIGLSNLAYVAWIGRWDQAREVSARTLAFSRGRLPENR